MRGYKCKYCKSTSFAKDDIHAEVYCTKCGLVHEHPPIPCNGKPIIKYCFR